MMDLDEVAKMVQAAGADLQRMGWIPDGEAPASVADYIAVSKYVDALGDDEIVDIVRQGLAVDTMTTAYAKQHKDLLRSLAREVILKKVESDAAGCPERKAAGR